ncbi:MAG: hypothetical protein HQK73_03945 [Desulfamplus sp.]|nr:hypothetical protein [Desulfamplus sp.]
MKQCSKNLKALALVILIQSFFIVMGGASIGQADSLFETAPLNEKFEKYIDDPKDEPIFDDAGNYFGFIPLPFMQEKHTAPSGLLKGLSLLRASVTSSVYDMRDPNNDGNTSDSLLSPVKRQGNCGSCWSFASLDVLESHLRAKNVNYDFSENHLINKHRFDLGPCDGGNIIFTSAYMAGYRGMVTEQDDPYKLGSSGNYCINCSPVQYIDNIILVPVRYDTNDNQYIKELIIDHGALYTSIYYDNNSYAPSSATYYYNDINNSFDDSNHAVVIVGWDDNKVVEGINKQGAFIVKNSWGSDWGDAGYFYVSYYDESIALSALAYFDDKDSSELRFNRVYQHDEIGWIGGAIGRDNGWGANWFIPENDGVLNAVSFAATNSNLSYEIIIYDERKESGDSVIFTNVLGNIQTGTIQNEGWYTIPLKNPVNLTAGDGFAVAVKFTTPDKQYPVPVESKIEGFTSDITINEGESYVSGDGGEWFDTYNLNNPYTVCIKALVQSEGEPANEECQDRPLQPEISIRIDGTKVDIFWQQDSCSKTEYNLYYGDYPYIIKSDTVHMGNKTSFSTNFSHGSNLCAVVCAKNTKGYAYSSLKSFEVGCYGKQICSTNKRVADVTDSVEKDQETVNLNWSIVTMSENTGSQFIKNFYSNNPDYEKHLTDMNIVLSQDKANLLPLQKSIWIYEVTKEIPYIGDIYFSNEILTSESGAAAIATVDNQGNRGLTFYGNLPYEGGGSGFITAIKEADCTAYYFFGFNDSGSPLSGRYQQKWCDSDSDELDKYYTLTASKINTSLAVSLINADKINIENITGETIPDDSLSHIKFDYLFPAMGKSVDIYIATYTPSGQLLFIDDKGDFTEEFGKAFKVSTTDTIRETNLFKKAYFEAGIYTAYWLIVPTNGGNINSINFDANDYILDAIEFNL